MRARSRGPELLPAASLLLAAPAGTLVGGVEDPELCFHGVDLVRVDLR